MSGAHGDISARMVILDPLLTIHFVSFLSTFFSSFNGTFPDMRFPSFKDQLKNSRFSSDIIHGFGAGFCELNFNNQKK